MTVPWAAAAWCFGLAGAASGLGVLALVVPLFYLARLRRRWAQASPARVVVTGLLLAAACVGGVWRFSSGQQARVHAPIEALAGRDAVVRGAVRGDPEDRGTWTRAVVDAREVVAGGGTVGEPAPAEARGGLLLRLGPGGLRLRSGDVVEVRGRLRAPPRFDDFDYAGWLRRQGVYLQADYPSVRVLLPARGGAPGGPLGAVRRALSANLQRVLPEPESGLARGALLGERAELPRAVTEAFQRTGAAHVLAISGWNMSVVAAVVLVALAWLIGRVPAAFVACVVVVLYTALVGAGPAVVRAALMAVAAAATMAAGRSALPALGLCYAVALMTALDPRVVFEASFQLSVAATAGVVLLAAPGARWARRRYAIGGLAGAVVEMLLLSVAASLAVLPVTARSFGTAAAWAPLVNLVAVPLAIPAIGGAALAAVSPWVPGLGWLFAGAGFAAMRTLRMAVEVGARLPGTGVHVSPPPAWLIAAWYGALAVPGLWLARRDSGPLRDAPAALRFDWRPSRRSMVLALAGSAAVLWTAVVLQPRPAAATVTVDGGGRVAHLAGGAVAVVAGAPARPAASDPAAAAALVVVDPSLGAMAFARDRARRALAETVVVPASVSATTYDALLDAADVGGARVLAVTEPLRLRGAGYDLVVRPAAGGLRVDGEVDGLPVALGAAEAPLRGRGLVARLGGLAPGDGWLRVGLVGGDEAAWPNVDPSRVGEVRLARDGDRWRLALERGTIPR